MSESGPHEQTPAREQKKWSITTYGSPLEGLFVGSSLTGFNTDSFLADLNANRKPSLDPLTPKALIDDPGAYDEVAEMRKNAKFIAKGEAISMFGIPGLELCMENEAQIGIKAGVPGQQEWDVNMYRGEDLLGNPDLLDAIQIPGDLNKVMDLKPVKGEDGKTKTLSLVYNPSKLQKAK